MKTKIANSITKSYADGVFTKFQDLAQGLNQAGSGAEKINQGASASKDGMIKLSDGVHQLNDGTAKLQAGSSKLYSGQTQLAQGIQVVKDGSTSLSSGLTQLSEGHKKLQAGTGKLTDSTNNLYAGNQKLSLGLAGAKSTADDLNSAINKYLQSHPEAQDDPDFQQILALSQGLTTAAESLKAGSDQLTNGAKQLAAGQDQLQQGMMQFGIQMTLAVNGAKQLANGTQRVADGFSQWGQGFTSLNHGINNLADGGLQLDSGSNKLVDGLGQLATGSNVLAVKLNDAAKQTSTVHNNDQLTSMFSEPVRLVENKVSNVPNYGIGITPYFLSLAFYVGGIMAANILPLGRRQDMLVNGTVHFINKLGLKYSIGFMQALIVDMVLLFGFKLHVASVPMFLISSMIVSFTFMTFILMLVTVFGVAGKFLAVTFLVLQLATCGGTFPGELGNPILSKIGQVLPMAHSLKSFQDVITLGDWSQLGQQILILFFYLVFAGAITWVTSHLQHSKTTVEASH